MHNTEKAAEELVVESDDDRDSILEATSLLDLPVEIFQHLISFLTFKDICQLGATCRHAHLLTSDELYWQLQVWKHTGVYLAQDIANFTRAFDRSNKHHLEGVVYDPTHQSIRNFSIIFSSEFRKIMMERKKKADEEQSKTSIKDIFPNLFDFFTTPPAPEDNAAARLVMFGPGIESVNTKLVVHKIVNARSSTFCVEKCIQGLPGGVGSGVRVRYKHMYSFDLMCLYSNSARVREVNKIERLDPSLNRMLVVDNMGQVTMQPSVMQLLSTIHGLVFVVDSTVENNEEESVAEEMVFIQKELMLMLASLSGSHNSIPVVVLSCKRSNGASHRSLEEITQGLCLQHLQRPWGVFEVCCDDMKGVEKGLDWLLDYLNRIKREEINGAMNVVKKRETRANGIDLEQLKISN